MSKERKNNKIGEKFTSILYIIILLVGAGFLLYPSFSDYYNSFHQSKAISSYVETISSITEEEHEQMILDAKNYNRQLQGNSRRWSMTDEEREEYNKLLDVSGTGMFGYIEIPKINVSLPIYHGTSDTVLQTAIGHVEGSSFPIGGEGTHSVLSGHRGLPSAKLFTDLDKLEVGDEFYLIILDEVLTYEVDKILIVLPNEMNSLEIFNKEDYCTLVTCTPYSVNTHRLLVRGKRIETVEKKEIKVLAEAIQIEPTVIAPFVGVPICFLYLVYLILKPKKKK